MSKSSKIGTQLETVVSFTRLQALSHEGLQNDIANVIMSLNLTL